LDFSGPDTLEWSFNNGRVTASSEGPADIFFQITTNSVGAIDNWNILINIPDSQENVIWTIKDSDYALDVTWYGRSHNDFHAQAENREMPGVWTVVPEPISSTLFIIGGATLGFRRFRKNFTK
jgi:hypothetical protein